MTGSEVPFLILRRRDACCSRQNTEPQCPATPMKPRSMGGIAPLHPGLGLCCALPGWRRYESIAVTCRWNILWYWYTQVMEPSVSKYCCNFYARRWLMVVVAWGTWYRLLGSTASLCQALPALFSIMIQIIILCLVTAPCTCSRSWYFAAFLKLPELPKNTLRKL